jgi:hypothetical protein
MNSKMTSSSYKEVVKWECTRVRNQERPWPRQGHILEAELEERGLVAIRCEIAPHEAGEGLIQQGVQQGHEASMKDMINQSIQEAFTRY